MQQKNALVIDDDKNCRALLADLLKTYRYRVTSFPEPKTFLNLHQQGCSCSESHSCFDLILTDNRMPGMSGIDFLRHIKQRGCKLPDNCKAIISGDWAHDDLREAKKLRCHIFQKLDLPEIFAWLNSLELNAPSSRIVQTTKQSTAPFMNIIK